MQLPVPETPPPRDLFQLRPVDEGSASPLTLQTISQFLYHSVAISAWKEVPGTGARWALRVNPSSGNLHPTETHVMLQRVEGIPDGLYHFRVDAFELEGRYQGSLGSLLQRIQERIGFRCGGVTFLLTSIFWREAWKYRDRAFRYCHHDLGHAMGAICVMLRGLGHEPRCAHVFNDAELAAWTGLSGGDEIPSLLISFGPALEVPDSPVADRPEALEVQGEPNRLSNEIIEYPSIDHVCNATAFATAGVNRDHCPRPGFSRRGGAEEISLAGAGEARADLWRVIRRRRSGINFDGRTGCTARDLGLMLRHATEEYSSDIFDFRRTQEGGEGMCHVHLYMYLHRVEDVAPGVYLYLRDRHALTPLKRGDQRGWASSLSLDQAIAGNSAFSVSMVADLRSAWERFGERGYRAVHIESGFIGQGLYLAAESLGLNATGIGAFFDDEVNRYLDLPDGREVVYHFTVGRALPDRRVRQLKSYWFEEAP